MFFERLDVTDASSPLVPCNDPTLMFTNAAEQTLAVNGAVFNIASGEAVVVENILKMLLSMSSKKIEAIPDPDRMRLNDTGVMAGNAEAGRRALQWQPRRKIEETLRSVLDDCRRAGK